MSGLTWGDFIRLESGGAVSEDECEYLLWSQTCYPFGDVRLVIKQLRGAIRARRNGITLCEICGKPKAYCICAHLMVKGE